MGRGIRRVVTLMFAATVAGCATTPRVHPRAAVHEYEGSVDLLTHQTIAFLEDQGYLLREKQRQADRCQVWTRWQWIVAAKRASQMHRYVAIIRQTRPGYATIQLARVARTTVGMAGYHPGQSTRDSRTTTGSGGSGADDMGSHEPLKANPDTVKRDLEMEWALLKALEPDAAHSIAVSRPVVHPRQVIASTSSSSDSSARGSR